MRPVKTILFPRALFYGIIILWKVMHVMDNKTKALVIDDDVNICELIDKVPELKKIIEKRDDGFSETPFIVKKEGKIYTGFIDRIILDGEESCNIYDYKTETGDTDKFKQQMDIYEEAALKIFPQRKRVKRYIVSLQNGKIQEI